MLPGQREAYYGVVLHYGVDVMKDDHLVGTNDSEQKGSE